MTADTSVDVREVIFINHRCDKDYGLLPQEVAETADGYMDAIQNGRDVPKAAFGPIANERKLAGIWELKLPYDGDAYRVYLWQGCSQAVWVLDAGPKKSNKGGSIPPWQKERLAERLSTAKARSEEIASELWDDYHARADRRRQLERSRSNG